MLSIKSNKKEFSVAESCPKTLLYKKLLCSKFSLYKPTLNHNFPAGKFLGATFLSRKVAKNNTKANFFQEKKRKIDTNSNYPL